MDLAEIRTGLYDTLRNAYPQLNVYAWPDMQPEPPCVLIAWPADVTYHGSVARCVSAVSITVTTMVANGDTAEATRQLDRYASSDGDQSLVVTLEDAVSAGWSNLTVVRATGWREIGELDVLAFDIELTVQA